MRFLDADDRPGITDACSNSASPRGRGTRNPASGAIPRLFGTKNPHRDPVFGNDFGPVRAEIRPETGNYVLNKPDSGPGPISEASETVQARHPIPRLCLVRVPAERTAGEAPDAPYRRFSRHPSAGFLDAGLIIPPPMNGEPAPRL